MAATTASRPASRRRLAWLLVWLLLGAIGAAAARPDADAFFGMGRTATPAPIHHF